VHCRGGGEGPEGAAHACVTNQPHALRPPGRHGTPRGKPPLSAQTKRLRQATPSMQICCADSR
jgi:hypothetical protein